MKRSASTLLAFALAVGSAAAIGADQHSTHSVHFARGTSASTISGSLHGYDTVNYTLGASAGQTMTVSISGTPDVYFNVIAPGEQYAMEGVNNLQAWTGRLPATGTYRVELFQPRAQARRGNTPHYTVHFQIH
jgi:hypothetical protein